jgi:hypothetical protein
MNRFTVRENGYALPRDLPPRLVPITNLQPLGYTFRKHAPRQVRKSASSLETFGFVLPVVIDEKGRVMAGWALGRSGGYRRNSLGNGAKNFLAVIWEIGECDQGKIRRRKIRRGINRRLLRGCVSSKFRRRVLILRRRTAWSADLQLDPDAQLSHGSGDPINYQIIEFSSWGCPHTGPDRVPRPATCCNNGWCAMLEMWERRAGPLFTTLVRHARATFTLGCGGYGLRFRVGAAL